jgi:hypothetical protein
MSIIGLQGSSRTLVMARQTVFALTCSPVLMLALTWLAPLLVINGP